MSTPPDEGWNNPPPPPGQGPQSPQSPQSPPGGFQAPIGGGVPGGQPQNAPGAVPALVLGIIGIVLCQLCAPFAWWQGKSAEDAITASGGTYGGKGMASAGKIMGIIGTVLLALGIVIVIVVVIAGAASSGSS